MSNSLADEPTGKLLFKKSLLLQIIAEAEANNDPLLDHPELRDNRPGAREQLKMIQDEIDRRVANGETLPTTLTFTVNTGAPPPEDTPPDSNRPKDQIVGLKTLSMKAIQDATPPDPDRKPST